MINSIEFNRSAKRLKMQQGLLHFNENFDQKAKNKIDKEMKNQQKQLTVVNSCRSPR